MGASNKGPKVVTVNGRLSFPRWTAQEAYDASQAGDYKAASPAEAKPEFTLLLEQDQFDKVLAQVENEFLPYCVEQDKQGEKRDKLTKKEAADILAQIKAGEHKDGVYNTPFKELSEKSAELAPECVVGIKCIGNAGVDIDLAAIVRDESELAVNDGSQLVFPVIKPLDQSTHSMYPGAYVAATLNLYAYHNGKIPGFSAGVSTAVFKADADRFGGGVSVDEDEIFMD